MQFCLLSVLIKLYFQNLVIIGNSSSRNHVLVVAFHVLVISSVSHYKLGQIFSREEYLLYLVVVLDFSIVLYLVVDFNNVVVSSSSSNVYHSHKYHNMVIVVIVDQLLWCLVVYSSRTHVFAIIVVNLGMSKKIVLCGNVRCKIVVNNLLVVELVEIRLV